MPERSHPVVRYAVRLAVRPERYVLSIRNRARIAAWVRRWAGQNGLPVARLMIEPSVELPARVTHRTCKPWCQGHERRMWYVSFRTVRNLPRHYWPQIEAALNDGLFPVLRVYTPEPSWTSEPVEILTTHRNARG